MSVSSNFKRKRRTKTQKEDIGQEFESGKRTCSELAGQYWISPILIYKWRRAMGKERNTGPDYQEILKELEKKDREIENLLINEDGRTDLRACA